MLVFLHPYKFTNFHYIRYELDVLEKKLMINLKSMIYQKLLTRLGLMYSSQKNTKK